MKPPAAPPPLVDMAKRKAEFEAKRAELFPLWKKALEAADGIVTRAAETFIFPGEVEPVGKSYGMFLTKTFDLRKYAEELRVKAGHTKRGRPWPKTGAKP